MRRSAGENWRNQVTFLRRFYAKCWSVSYSEEDHAEHPVALRNQRSEGNSLLGMADRPLSLTVCFHSLLPRRLQP